MLLKQSNPEHATNSIPPVMDSQQDATLPHADPLDDVFGSDGEDDSPFLEGDLDSGIQVIRREDPAFATRQNHPSDVHRLQQEHTTAGYRDGVTVAKASSVQAGFDEGFGLGATIGLKAGRLLGLLEGVAGALRSAGAEGYEGAAARLTGARAELDVRSVFGESYWNMDGTWKYDVGEGQGEEEGESVLFSHVAEAHPLVRKWTAVVDEEVARWGLQEQLPLLQRREAEDGLVVVEPAAGVKASTQSQGGAEAASHALNW